MVSSGVAETITYTDIPNIGNLFVAFSTDYNDPFEEWRLAGLLGKASKFLPKTATWDEEKNIAENSVMTEEDAKKLMGEDAQVTEFQNNVEEITFLGEKHYAAQYTFKNYDVSYYGVTVFLVNEQDSQYMLAVNIIGVDLNVVDQADQFFSVYTE